MRTRAWYKIETEDGDVGWVCGGQKGEVWVQSEEVKDEVIEDPYPSITPLERLLNPGSSF